MGADNNGNYTTVGDIDNVVITSRSRYGINNNGKIDSVTNSTINVIEGGWGGIWNRAGRTIDKIENTDIIVTAKGENYGIWNDGAINSLSKVTAAAGADGEMSAGIYNDKKGTIVTTKDSVFTAGHWGINNFFPDRN